MSIKMVGDGKHSLQESNWEKEFKGELYDYGYVGGISLSAEIDLKDLLETYLGKLIDNPTKDGVKVKIKVRKGCIQIERIE